MRWLKDFAYYLYVIVYDKRNANPKIYQAKVGLDFSAKFIRPISRQCVCNIIQQKEEIKAFVEADPELEIKKKQETHIRSRK